MKKTSSLATVYLLAFAACGSPMVTAGTPEPLPTPPDAERADARPAQDARFALETSADRSMGETGPAPDSGGAGGQKQDGGLPPAPPGTVTTRPRPGRLIVLGDSIAACQNVGGIDGADCSPKKLHAYLKDQYSPTLSYENRAVGGAVTADVPADQLAGIAPGPEHLLVLVFVGGNDLRKYLISSDAVAERGYTTELPQLQAAWGRIFAHFADRTRFPGGYTLVMNTQYSPFDGCTAAPFFISAKKNQLLEQLNGELGRLAQQGGALLVDQYTPFLGHANHYTVRTCPHYLPGATFFMSDLIHPNAAGHDNLFQQWKKLADASYR